MKAEFGFNWPVAAVNATRIARETIGLPITNIAMAGALLKITKAVRIDSLVERLQERLGIQAEGNIEAMKKAYKETVIKE